MTIHVSIGNSDDRLTQRGWSEFCGGVDAVIRGRASVVHGEWYSPSRAPWQNACWAFEVPDVLSRARLRQSLAHLASVYRQDSIAWAESETTFIKAAT